MPPYPWAPLSGLQAIWSRFFPAMEALQEVLAQGTVGDLRVARAEFGAELSHLPRSTDWSQAGGSLLDLGIYCVQFLSMVFGGQKPEKVSAVGRIHETGTAYPRLDGGWRRYRSVLLSPASTQKNQIRQLERLP